MKLSRALKWGFGVVVLIAAAVGGGMWLSQEEGPATQAEYDALLGVQRLQGQVFTNPKGHVTKVAFNSRRIRDNDLALLEQFPDLELLNLESTLITNDGLAHLAGLSELKNLSLKNTKIGDEGLVHLKGLPSLEELDLEYTKITDGGLPNLAAISSLRKLYVGPGGPSNDGVEYLRAKNPKMQVFSSRR